MVLTSCARRVIAIGAVVLSMPPLAAAAIFHRNRTSPSRHASGVTMRKRLHVNDLIAEPGTVELDAGLLYSYATGALTAPSALKFTPAGESLFWGRTEYSVAFDSVSSAVDAGARATQFSDRITFAATSVVFDSEHFDIAVAPQVTRFLRNESGVRLGGAAIARYDGHGNSIGVTASWTAATANSDTNPAGIWDFSGGFGRQLAAAGVLSHFTPHITVTAEKATGFARTLSAFAGVEYQVTARFAVDLSAQRYNLNSGVPDRQVLVGMTVNFGQVGR